MTWPTLRAVQAATTIEFTPEMVRRHHFVRCLDGRWTRTLGAPSPVDPFVGAPRPLRNIRGQIWHMIGREEQP